MKSFQARQDLLQSVDGLHGDGALFVNVLAWKSSPLTTPILLLPERDDELEDLDDEESHLPKEAKKRCMNQLLDVQTLQDVVSFERRRNPAHRPAIWLTRSSTAASTMISSILRKWDRPTATSAARRGCIPKKTYG